MRMIVLAAIMIITSLHAAPTNQFRAPYCSPTVKNLPIYQLQADSSKNKSGQALYSTVVLIGKNAWATASHSVAWGKASKIKILLPDGRKVSARVTQSIRSKDIAVLSAPSFNIKPIDTLSFDLNENEQIWNIGYPTMADGELLSFTGMFVRYNKNNMIVTTALGLSGMSGGATVRCVNGNVELVGIITALIQDSINEKVWTDKDGILRFERTLINSGSTIISPVIIKK